VHATLLAVATWVLFVASVARPGILDITGGLKGGDFLQFYTAGAIHNEGSIARLYDLEFFWDKGEQVSGYAKEHYLPVYPPQVAWMFAPFAHFSYTTALYLWWIIGTVCYAAAMVLVYRSCPALQPYKRAFIMAAIGFPGFFQAIGNGQVSLLLTLIGAGAMLLFAKGHPGWAGVVLGLAAFKPQVFASMLLVLLIARQWKTIAGATSTAVLQLAALAAFAGATILKTYLELAITLPKLNDTALAVKPYQMHSLRGFWYLLVGEGKLYVLLSAISILATLVLFYKAQHAVQDRLTFFAICVLAAMLVNPHVYIYDLAILAPALAVLINQALMNGWPGRVGILVYATFVALLVAPGSSQFTHVQLSVVLLAALLWQFAKSQIQKLPLSNQTSEPKVTSVSGST
jgi:arabinofuranan 3-O-arabinosyltransferase